MSSEISSIITQRQLKTELKPVNNCNNPIDELFVELSDLVNPEFKAWYCKSFYKLGRDHVLVLASKARVDGFDKRKYFSSLLKKSCV